MSLQSLLKEHAALFEKMCLLQEKEFLAFIKEKNLKKEEEKKDPHTGLAIGQQPSKELNELQIRWYVLSKKILGMKNKERRDD